MGVLGDLRELQERQLEVLGDQVALLAISTDPIYALRAFADQHGFTFPMLSDFWPHGAVASAYGVFSDEVGIALRGSFLVDTDGVLRWSMVHGIPEARDVDEYIRAIEALQQAAL